MSDTAVTLTIPTHLLAGFVIQFAREHSTLPLLSAEAALRYLIEDAAETLFLSDTSHVSSGVVSCAACAPHVHAFTALQNALSTLSANYGLSDDAPLFPSTFTRVTDAADVTFGTLAQAVVDNYAIRSGETRPLHAEF